MSHHGLDVACPLPEMLPLLNYSYVIVIESGLKLLGCFSFFFFFSRLSSPWPGTPISFLQHCIGPSPAAGGGRRLGLFVSVRHSLGTEPQDTFPAGRNQLQPESDPPGRFSKEGLSAR